MRKPVQSTLEQKQGSNRQRTVCTFQPVESIHEKAEALRIGLEILGVPITIAARRVGLKVKDATALYVKTVQARRRMGRVA